MSNIFYFNHINKIGGVETFFYQLAKQFKNRDITIIYKTGNKAQIDRLSKYVRVIKYNGKPIKCNKAFLNYNLDIIDNVLADEYIQILHGDYKTLGVLPNMHPKITRYISVSELVKESFKALTGKNSTVIYNPLKIDAPKRVLLLVSATRLTPDKGSKRIAKLANMLSASGIPYLWLIFTDSKDKINNDNIVYMGTRLNIQDFDLNLPKILRFHR